MRKLFLDLVLCISACATTVPVTPKLPLPDKPSLPAIPASELMCISDSAYRTLVEREKLWINYTETLRNIIQTTH